MYQTQFGLQRRLFDEGVAADAAVFRNRQHTELVEQFKLAFASSTSVVVLRGPAGVGKSTLTSAALRATSTRLALAWLNGTPMNAAELLELLLVELGVNTVRTSRIERLQLWRQFQSEMAATDSRLFIVVERTEDLPVEVLHALDSATAADSSGHPGANVVLLGHLRIEDHLADPVLDSFRQRIRLRCELKPFTEAELQDYLRHRVGVAGGQYDRIFASGTVAALHRYSRGVTRLANNLCETALTLAASRNQKSLSADLVNEAAVTWLGLSDALPAGVPSVASTTAVAAKPTGPVVAAPKVEAAPPAPAAPAPPPAPTAFTVAPAAPVAPPITVVASVALAPLAPSAAITVNAPVRPAAPAVPATSAAAAAPPVVPAAQPARVAAPAAPTPPLVAAAAPTKPPPATPPLAPAPTPVAATTVARPPAPRATPSVAAPRVEPRPEPRSTPPSIAPEFDGGATDLPDVSIIDFPVLTDAVDSDEPRAAQVAAAAPPKPTPKPPPAPTVAPAAPPPRAATPPATAVPRPTPPPVAPPRVEAAYAATRPVPPAPPVAPPKPAAASAPARPPTPPPPAAAAKPPPPSAPPKAPTPSASEPQEEDDLMRQTQTMRAISEAKSIVDISDTMAETLFGDAELDFLSTSLAAGADWKEPDAAPTTPAKSPAASAPAKPAKAKAPSSDDDLLDLLGLSDAPLELIDDSAQPPADPTRKSGSQR